MGINLTNTFGVYENFKKQPHPAEAVRYGSIAAPDVPSNQANAYAVIEAINGAAGLVTSQLQAKEELRKAEGLKRAQELIISTSEKDKVELGIRELLQKSGAIDLADNVYATALIEKDVGKTMSNLFSLQYKENLTQTESYAKTREEQIQHFNDERRTYYDKIKADRGSLNQTAFDIGFNESFAVDENSVFDLHTKWHSEKSRSEALSTLRLNMLSYDYDAGMADGSYSNQIGEYINTARTVGISEEQVRDVLSEVYQNYLSRGGNNPAIIDNIWNTNVGIHRTGERLGQPKTYGDMIGEPQIMKDAMAASNQIMNTERSREISRILEQAVQTSPEKVDEEFAKLTPAEKKLYNADSLRKRAASMQQSKLKILTMQNYNQRSMEMAATRLDEYFARIDMGEMTYADGTPLPVRLSEFKISMMDEKGNIKERALTENEYWEYIMTPKVSAGARLKLLSTPMGLTSINTKAKDHISRLLGQISPGISKDTSRVKRIQDSLEGYFEMYKADSSKFLSVYGDELYAEISSVMDFANTSGDVGFANVLERIADRRTMLADTAGNRMIRTEVEKQLNNVTHLEVMNMNGKSESAIVSPDMRDRMFNYTMAAVGGNADIDTAISKVQTELFGNITRFKYGNCVADFPTDLIRTAGFDNSVLEQVLDYICYQRLDGTSFYDTDLVGSWDNNRKVFRIGILGVGEYQEYTLDYIKNQHEYLRKKLLTEEAQKKGQNSAVVRAKEQARSRGFNIEGGETQ